MPDETPYDTITSRSTPPLTGPQLEFLWALCYSVTKGEIVVHPEHLVEARALEPVLYKVLQEMAPGWESPLKLMFN